MYSSKNSLSILSIPFQASEQADRQAERQAGRQARKQASTQLLVKTNLFNVQISMFSNKKHFPQARKHREGASEQADHNMQPYVTICDHTQFYLTVCNHIGRAALKAPYRQLHGQGQARLTDCVWHPGRRPFDPAWRGICVL